MLQILCLLAITGAMAQQINFMNQTVQENCYTTQECQTQLGPGSCCLYESFPTPQYNCRDQKFLSYYFQSINYDPLTRNWTDPDSPLSNQLTIYCRQPARQNLTNRYPYQQPFLNTTNYTISLVNGSNMSVPLRYDQFDPNIHSDMFYQPFYVQEWGEQFLKWLNAVLWFFTPLPAMIWMNNWFNYSIDSLFYVYGTADQGYRPSMYNNWFTSIFMSSDMSTFGLFKYWDVFTLQGFDNWFWTALICMVVPWWEVYMAIMRSVTGDWTYGTLESYNNVNKNRYLPYFQWVDPYNYDYWTTKSDGVDCNGNVGLGNYCYCPSQGYTCQCRKQDWYPAGYQVNNCYDHYGYDCLGQRVDGEQNWCQERNNIYYTMSYTQYT